MLLSGVRRPRCCRGDTEEANACIRGPDWRQTLQVISISKILKAAELAESTTGMSRIEWMF